MFVPIKNQISTNISRTYILTCALYTHVVKSTCKSLRMIHFKLNRIAVRFRLRLGKLNYPSTLVDFLHGLIITIDQISTIKAVHLISTRKKVETDWFLFIFLVTLEVTSSSWNKMETVKNCWKHQFHGGFHYVEFVMSCLLLIRQTASV